MSAGEVWREFARFQIAGYLRLEGTETKRSADQERDEETESAHGARVRTPKRA